MTGRFDQKLAIPALAAVAAGVIVCLSPGPAAAATEPEGPTVAIIQAAYEQQAANGDKRHDKDLELVAADCSRAPALDQHLCWVTFTTRTNPEKPLYFDVAVIERSGGTWDLKSGLCKR